MTMGFRSEAFVAAELAYRMGDRHPVTPRGETGTRRSHGLRRHRHSALAASTALPASVAAAPARGAARRALHEVGADATIVDLHAGSRRPGAAA
jgi:hypothetical protein